MSSSKILPRIFAALQRTKIITRGISVNNYLAATDNSFHYNTKLVIDNEKWRITGHDSHYWIISLGEIRARQSCDSWQAVLCLGSVNQTGSTYPL
jgi:hypothetical protein